MIYITKVVSRNFIVDWIESFRNMIGKNLTGYEKMINKGMEQIEQELKDKKIQLRWYQITTVQLTSGAISITLYGEAY